MSPENFIKNITSKDIKLSLKEIENMIKACDIEAFSLLCKKSDFIFPFLKDRISNDFVKLIKEENLNSVFEFSKTYCADFEDIIVHSWLKFASQDLTDDILDIFENGTIEQKAYCAKYFSQIQDPLALEFLNKYALCDFEPLKTNCATALNAFGDFEILNKMKEIILTSCDDFEKNSAFEFICAYGGENSVKFVMQNIQKSPFKANIVSNLLNNNDFNFIKNILNAKEITDIFAILYESYPEDISLDTISYYQISDFIEYIQKNNNQYSTNLLYLTKNKFKEFQQNDIYLFDLDKNTKNELTNITKKLETIEFLFDNIQEELETYKTETQRYFCALEVIKEKKLTQYCEFLANLINNSTIKNELLAKTAETLKELNKTNLIDINAVENIENINIKALVKSYL